jgi:Flp pilus assembly protein CpaB
VIFAVVGILCMLGALGLSIIAYTSAGQGTGIAGPTLPVVVATHDIAVNTKLGAGDVTTIPYPAAALPSDYVSSPTDVINYFTAITLARNDPVLRNIITNKPGSGPQNHGFSLPNQLQRAGDSIVSLAFDPLSMGGGYLQTGDHVDIYSSGALQVADAIVMRVGTPEEVAQARSPSVIILEAKPDGIAKLEQLVNAGSKFGFILLSSTG